jgi:hypothetical protein
VGRLVRCLRPYGATLRRHHGTAVVLPKPKAISHRQWPAQISRAGESMSQTLDVPAGRWNVSLQYVSKTGLDLSAPGYRATLPPNLARMGPYWPAGSLTQRRSGPLTINVHIRPGNAVSRLLRAPLATLALNANYLGPIGRLTLTRADVPPRVAPLAATCGRYVDWYHLGGPVTLPGS